jgi:vitamin K-dependent gamma-carboxylase
MRELVLSYISKMKKDVSEKTNAIPLEIFRIILGISFIAETARLFHELSEHFIQPDFFFKFSCFSFVEPLSKTAMQSILAIMFFASIGIILKKLYKPSLVLYLLGYTYFFLLDLSLYNNHYYLFILIIFLMLIIPQEGSIKEMRKGIIPQTSQWGVWILQFQLFVIYFYGGIAKLDSDWLNGSVIRATFQDRPESIPSFLPLDIEQAATFYTYGGLFFDLLIVPLLLFKKTRLPAFVALLFFHISNAISLDIGVFPYFMIGASILFWNGKELTPLLQRLKILPQKLFVKKDASTHFEMYVLLKIAILIYILIQLLLPFRHHLIPNNVNWTGQGKFFSWRMKMPHKKPGQIQILTYDKASGEQLFPKVDIRPHQLNALIYHPTLLPQLLDALANNLNKQRNKELDFKVNINVSMNGRPMQQVYISDKNISKLQLKNWQDNNWILPLTPSN